MGFPVSRSHRVTYKRARTRVDWVEGQENARKCYAHYKAISLLRSNWCVKRMEKKQRKRKGEITEKERREEMKEDKIFRATGAQARPGEINPPSTPFGGREELPGS